MDDLRIGRLARAIRRKLGWRQADVAAKARIAQSMVSLFERGHLEELSLRSIRRICGVLEIRLDLVPKWRGALVDRVLDERHAALVESVIQRLAAAGWQARAEVTFSSYGERGSIDVFAWHAAERAVLIVEIKSEATAVEGTARPLDVKRRLAADLAQRELGWRPRVVGTILVFPENAQTRRRIEAHRATFASILPGRFREIRAWLRRPAGPLGAIWFLSLNDQVAATLRPASRIRLRAARCRSASDIVAERGTPAA